MLPKWEVTNWLSSTLPYAIPKEDLFKLVKRPKSAENGDLAVSTFELKKYGIDPSDLEVYLDVNQSQWVRHIEVKGNFLNIFIDRVKLMKVVIPLILRDKENYGKTRKGEGQVIVIDFGSPNIAKPFHAGHLRSTIIGNFLKNIYKFNGYKVVGINYLGDWGKQYGILAVGYKKYGDEDKLSKDPIKHLFDVYVQINKDAKKDDTINEEARRYFKKMEDGDEEALSLWKRFRNMSIDKYKKIFERLNIHFDVYSGESLYENKMKDVLQELKDKDLLKDSGGAKIIDLSTENIENAMVLKSDGTTLYLTRDIAAAKDRFETHNFTKSFYVVASQQNLHFRQLICIMDKMGYKWAKDMVHISYGMVKGMSTRDGEVQFLEDIIRDSKEVMHEVMRSKPEKYEHIEDPENVAHILAMSAIVVQDFSSRRIKGYDYDLKRMCSFVGDTGPYLQYTHVRLSSIERKYVICDEDLEKIDFTLLKGKDWERLVSHLDRFDEVVSEALDSYEPCILVNYLMDLCHIISIIIESQYVLGQEKHIADARIAAYMAAKYVLGNGLRIMGLIPLTRM